MGLNRHECAHTQSCMFLGVAHIYDHGYLQTEADETIRNVGIW